MNKFSQFLAGALLLSGGRIIGPDPFGPVVPKGKAPDPEPHNPFTGPNDPWIPFTNDMLEDQSIKRIRIDTRDYYCIPHTEVKKYPDVHKARKKPHFYYHTNEEIVTLIARYFEESQFGDPKKNNHVHLALVGVFRSMHGQMKYTELIRITDQGWAVCSGEELFMFNKADLAQPVFHGRRDKS